MTLEALVSGGCETALKAAFDESREQLVFRGTFPHPEFLRRLVEKFVTSTNPRSLRRILLISEGDLPEATSASFHLPQTYDTSFPCAHCTVYRTKNETYPMFIEVFHFTNRNDPSVCATVSFRMSDDQVTNNITTSDSRVEMYLSESCVPPRAPFARSSRKLFTQFDTSFALLREVTPDGLEKLQAVSQGWRATIDRHKKALPERKLHVGIKFHCADPSGVTVVMSRWIGEYEQVLRVLVPHGPEQLCRMLRKHLCDALARLWFFSGENAFRHPPQDAMLYWDQSKALVWTVRFLQSLKRTQVRGVKINTEFFGIDNLPALMTAARSFCSVGTFDLFNFPDDAFAVSDMVDLLRDPTAVASNKIVVRTRFLDAKDTSNVIREFCVQLFGATFADLPPARRMKQFRQAHNRFGKEVTTRVFTYRNAHTGDFLSAVRHADRTHHSRILFLTGHLVLDDLRNKWTIEKY